MKLRIKEIIKEKGVSVGSLSEKVGITQPNMSNIINGKITPSIERLESISNALGVEFIELFVLPKKDKTKISCPHCGKEINLTVNL